MYIPTALGNPPALTSALMVALSGTPESNWFAYESFPSATFPGLIGYNNRVLIDREHTPLVSTIANQPHWLTLRGQTGLNIAVNIVYGFWPTIPQGQLNTTDYS
jgi:hypothetical protein